jgi:hypothetical protein
VKKILIGVLFVVGIVAIGLGVTSLVYGQFGTQKDVVVGHNPYPVPPTTVGAYPAPFMLDTNGLESRTISNTVILRSPKLIEQYSKLFTRCYYEDAKFTNGTSTIHISERSMILKVDDRFTTNMDILDDNRASMMLFRYQERYAIVMHSGGGWSPFPVEPGDYTLQFSTVGVDDYRIKDESIQIVNAKVFPVNGDFVIMVCNVR